MLLQRARVVTATRCATQAQLLWAGYWHLRY